jgi:hypothetical protein
MLARHLLVGLSVAALGAASIRIASTALPRGLERAIGSAAIAATLAVMESLGLGLLGAAGSPLALSGAAVATWIGAHLVVAAPAAPVRAELLAWWSSRSGAERIGMGALVGLAAGLAAWVLRSPALGGDAVIYHLTEVVIWVQTGHPGSIEPLIREFPVGNYPLTDEVLRAWLAGISHSFVAMALWTPASCLLLTVAGWVGLRELQVPRLPRALAVTALVSAPLAFTDAGQSGTDLPALTWLVATAALSAVSRRAPAAIAPAVLAAGLAVGTKTTTLPLAALALLLAGLAIRRELRRLLVPLALGATGALVAGGIWYARNLLDHGSAFWPFVAAPWGDPVPFAFERLNAAFLDRPRSTLDALGSLYPASLAGGVVLLAAAAVAPLLARRRQLVAASAVTAAALLVWLRAPFTGSPTAGLALSTLRYLLPTLAAAALAIALLSRERGRYAVATAALLGAVAWNLVRLQAVGPPIVPRLTTLLAAAVVGGMLGLVLTVARLRALGAGWRGGPALVALAAGAILAVAAPGYVERQANAGGLRGSAIIRWFVGQPAFDDRRAVAMGLMPLALLAGDELQHPLHLVTPRESCASLEEHLRRGWVVLAVNLPTLAELKPFTAIRCLDSRTPLYDDGLFRAYALAAVGERRP